jgi:uncharacterized tellurite resistance protein B-like protein
MSFIGLQENYNRIRTIIQMAKSDGQVNLAELTYIIWLSQKLGISKSELNELVNEEANFSAPFSEDERTTLLYDIVTLMYVDGEVAQEELKHIESIAQQMNFNDSAIQGLLSSIKEQGNQLMNRAAFDAIFA